MKKTISLVTVLLLFITLFSCSSDNGSSSNNGWENVGSSAFGKFIEIPGIDSETGTGAALDLKATNEGLYMNVNKYEEDTSWIYRLQQGGPSPSWIFHEQTQLFFDWAPSSYQYEVKDTFAIFFHSLYTNGYVNINTGLPALLEENNPYILSGAPPMLVDNSPSAHKWYFEGSTVKIQENNSAGLFQPICTLPTSGGINFAEADPKDAIIWAAAGSIIYKITVNGQITSFNVGSYNDSNFPLNFIEKIRFSYDVLHKDVYFRYQNKVFKITDGTSLSLFYTINNESNFLGGDFCVDNGYMYASDGTKKDLQFLTETNIIPDMPNSTNQQVLIDYFTQVSAFKSGQMETSVSSTGSSLYILSSDKILVVPKRRN